MKATFEPVPSFCPTDETAMIFIAEGETFYPYWVKKMGDSTHLVIVNDPKHFEHGWPSHVAEFRSHAYYEDLRQWLHGQVSSEWLNGRQYAN